MHLIIMQSFIIIQKYINNYFARIIVLFWAKGPLHLEESTEQLGQRSEETHHRTSLRSDLRSVAYRPKDMALLCSYIRGTFMTHLQLIMLYDGIASTTKSAWLAISNGMSRKSEQCYILRFLHIWIWTMMMMMKQQCTLSGSVGGSGHSLPIVSTSLMSFLFFHRHYHHYCRDRHYHYQHG